MNKYVVAIISFFENDLKQFKIEAENEYEAVKKAMIEKCGDDEEMKKYELDWQNSEEYPTDLLALYSAYYNADMAISTIQIKEF